MISHQLSFSSFLRPVTFVKETKLPICQLAQQLDCYQPNLAHTFYQPPADSFSNWSQHFWGIPQPIKGWSWQLQDYLLKPRGAGKQRRCECWLVKRWPCSVCWDFAHLQHQTGIQVKIKALFVKKYHLLLSSCSCHVVSTVKLNLNAGTAIKAVEKYTKIWALCLS